MIEWKWISLGVFKNTPMQCLKVIPSQRCARKWVFSSGQTSGPSTRNVCPDRQTDQQYGVRTKICRDGQAYSQIMIRSDFEWCKCSQRQDRHPNGWTHGQTWRNYTSSHFMQSVNSLSAAYRITRHFLGNQCYSTPRKCHRGHQVPLIQSNHI